jgi:1,4-alpha-glucan branching enzyme
VIAYHRWHQSGKGDDVVVVVNLSHMPHQDYRLGFPANGIWRLRFNSDSNGYSPSFSNTLCDDVIANPIESSPTIPDASQQRDGFRNEGLINIGPYSVIILSQDKV